MKFRNGKVLIFISKIGKITKELICYLLEMDVLELYKIKKSFSISLTRQRSYKRLTGATLCVSVVSQLLH